MIRRICMIRKGEEALRTKLMIRCLVAVLLGLSCAPQPTTAAVAVDLAFFHDRLAPYGDWIQHPRRGCVRLSSSRSAT